jgi:hypothetical protein
MDDLTRTAVFFDIGDTMASVTLAPDGRIAGPGGSSRAGHAYPDRRRGAEAHFSA